MNLRTTLLAGSIVAVADIGALYPFPGYTDWLLWDTIDIMLTLSPQLPGEMPLE